MVFDFTPDLLIVDDRRENLDLLGALLGKMDVNLELIQSPKKALQKIQQKEYALIILDIQMPEMDGFTLAEQIRKGNLNATTPIVFLTAFYLDKKSEQKGYECGCADFIMKPFNSTILKNKVNVFLELFKNKKEKELQNEQLNSALKEKELFENRLRNLAIKYRTILEGQHELILKLDSSLKIEFANKAFTDFFDYTIDGISANTVCDINQELSEQFAGAIKGMNGKSESFIIEKPITNYLSEQRWIEWSVFKQVGLEDVHYQFIGRDVTDKRFLKDTLVKKELLVRKIQKLAGIGTFEWDSYSSILRGSMEFYRLYEISDKDMENILESIKLKCHEDDLPAIQRLLLHLSRKNQKLEFEHRIVTSNHEIKHVRVEMHVEHDEETDVLHISGIARDITEDIALGNTFKYSLGFDKEHYKDKAFFELNEKNKIVYLNDIARKFLECPEESYSGKKMVDFIDDSEKDKFIKCFDLKKNKKGFVLEIFTLHTSSEQIKKIILVANVFNTRNNIGIKGILTELPSTNGKFSDESEYKEIIIGLKRQEKVFKNKASKLKNIVDKEIQINEFQRQLLSKKSELESLGKIASSVVHEINQPLTGISMIMDNILLRLSMDNINEEYIREKCSQVFTDIDRIKSYISQIGIFNSSQKKSSVDLVDVNQVIESSVKLVKKHFRNEKVNLKIDSHEESLLISGNKYKLQKVLVDILNNSYDSINEKLSKKKKNGKNIIQISSKLVNQNVVVSIKDNGIGIDPENLNFIFEPFFSTKKNGDGSGLGLYVSKDVVQKMNGKIDVSSQKDEFTEMKLIFPKQPQVEKKEVYFKES